MRKYGYISLVLGIVLCCSGIYCIIFDNFDSVNLADTTNDVSEVEFDENYIDRSLEEKQIRESTGNSYYTINTSLKLSNDRSYEGLQITNSRLVRIDKEWYSFSCTLTNTLSTVFSASTFDVDFIDKDGNLIFKGESFVSAINPGATATLSVTTQNDILDSYDFNIIRTGDYIPVTNDIIEAQE